MAGKPVQNRLNSPQAPQPKRAANVPFSGYIRADLNTGEKEEYLQWCKDTEDSGLLELLGKAADDGYKVSVGLKGDEFMSSMHCQDEASESYGWMLTGWASDAVSALYVLFYKHTVKLGKDWGTSNEGGGWNFR